MTRQITTAGELTMFIAKHRIKTDWSNAEERGVDIRVRAGKRTPAQSVLLRKDGKLVAEVDIMLLLKFATPYSRTAKTRRERRGKATAYLTGGGYLEE